MAYGTIYRAGYSSKNVRGYVYIDKEGYVGPVSDLILEATPEIRYRFNDWEDPIIGLSASFAIINNGADFFDLLPLMMAEEREYRVQIVETSPLVDYLIFSGFLNCEDSETGYLRKRPIRLNASSYLSKLEYVNPPIIDTIQDKTLIDIIIDCLSLTGSEDDIRVNSTLRNVESTLSPGQTLFNKCSLTTEIFWRDNVEKDNALGIIREILKPFFCFIYWFNGSWYIERYEDLGLETKNYIVYDLGVSSYGYDDAGTVDAVSGSPVDISSEILRDQSQLIGVQKGLKEIEIKLDQLYLSNLTINDFSLLNASSISTGFVPYPALRKWNFLTDASTTWGGLALPLWFGRPYKNISNSILRTGNTDGKPYYGLYTRFPITKSSETSLTVKFKYAPQIILMGSFSKWEDYTFKFVWYLRVTPGNYFITFDSVAGTWSKVVGSEETGVQLKEVAGTEFDNENGVAEVTISVPLGAVSGLSDGTQNLVLGIGSVQYIKDPDPTVCYVGGGIFGDVFITASGDIQDNNILYSVNSKFLNKKTITLKVFDAASRNIKNGILYGGVVTESLLPRTATWTTDGILQESLVDHLVRNKYQLYRISRERISTRLISSAKFKPLSLFSDSNQAGKKFVLGSFGYFPGRDIYEIELREYDNQETINFV